MTRPRGRKAIAHKEERLNSLRAFRKPAGLPVDPARLKAQFPSLTDEDLEAYGAVTRRILAAPTPEDRARVTRETLALGRAAREKRVAGEALTPKEDGALRYLGGVDKMQTR